MQRNTVSALLRATQAYCQQLCDKETLEHGIAFFSARYPLLPDVNQFREVVIDSAEHIPRVFDETERWFEGHGLSCLRWATAGGAPGVEIRDLLLPRCTFLILLLLLLRGESVKAVETVEHRRSLRVDRFENVFIRLLVI